MNSKKLFSIILCCKEFKTDDLIGVKDITKCDITSFLQAFTAITKLSKSEIERIYSSSLKPEGAMFTIMLDEESAEILDACFFDYRIVISHKIRTMCTNVKNSNDKIIDFVSNTSAIVSEYANMSVENAQLRRKISILKARNKELEESTKNFANASGKLAEAKREADSIFRKIKEVEKLFGLS